MAQTESNGFYNRGFGWICRRCEQTHESPPIPSGSVRSRLLSEGEAEKKQPTLSTTALAKWTDKTQTTLICPTCKVSERVE